MRIFKFLTTPKVQACTSNANSKFSVKVIKYMLQCVHLLVHWQPISHHDKIVIRMICHFAYYSDLFLLYLLQRLVFSINYLWTGITISANHGITFNMAAPRNMSDTVSMVKEKLDCMIMRTLENLSIRKKTAFR